MSKKFLSSVVAIFILSFAVRATGLGAIDQVVFDEVHFGKFISSYCCTHQRFFDIHPPIGKLLIAGGAYVAGYDGHFSFDHIGQTYSDVPIAGIRIVPAFFGALLPVIIMILLRQAGVSTALSFVGGVAVALENALIVESRFILTDSILLTATFGAIASAIAAVQTKSKVYSWLFVCLAGILAGIAVGTKFTGAIGGGLAAIILVIPGLTRNPGYVDPGSEAGMTAFYTWFWKMLLFTVIASAVYIFGWMLHFSLLTMPGSGDAWGVPTGNFWHDIVTVHQQMLSANYNLTAGHPYGSRWYTWPFMVRSVFYWQSDGDRFLYLLGNPIVWWGSFALFCTGIVLLFARLATRRGFRIKSGMTIQLLFLLGYLGSYIPLMRVPRVLFLYHYLTPLLFSLLFGIWWLDSVLRGRKRIIAICITVLVIAGFLFMSPLTYGFGASENWRHALFSISSWR